MDKKYILSAGFVLSNDGDRHLITCQQLCELYNLDPNECVFIGIDTDPYFKLRGLDTNNMITLYPRHKGDYTEYLQRTLQENQNK